MNDSMLLIYIFIFVGFILLLRLIGAWMLRINEVIDNQKTQIQFQELLMNNLSEIKANQEIMIGVLRRIADKGSQSE